jgi:hypothetical protein
MGQSLQRTVAFLVLVASGGVLASSCATNESSLFIRGCLETPQDTCTVSPDVSATQIFAGRLDPAQGTGYNGILLFGNQLVARGNSTQLRTETSRIEVQSADVTIYDSTMATTYITYSVPASGFADPGTSTQPGFGAVKVLLIDAVTAAAHPGTTLVAGVILHGRTLGGLELESGEWQFPVEVLQRGALCYLDPCRSGVIGADMPIVTCHPGYDSVTDCRQGCGCSPGLSDCAPLGCVIKKTGDKIGICGGCTSSAQCAPGTKCATTGYCQ